MMSPLSPSKSLALLTSTTRTSMAPGVGGHFQRLDVLAEGALNGQNAD